MESAPEMVLPVARREVDAADGVALAAEGGELVVNVAVERQLSGRVDAGERGTQDREEVEDRVVREL